MTMENTTTTYRTRGGVTVHRRIEPADAELDVPALVEALEERRGALFSSSYEYPGRYTRWDIGFVDPPLALTTRDRAFRLDALNARGTVLLDVVGPALAASAAVESVGAVEGAGSTAVDADG